jgi:hypothetical protein
MLDIDDLMVVTAASSLPPKWNNFKQALGVAMMKYGDKGELQLIAEEMEICLDVCTGIMHRLSSDSKTVAHRRTYCSDFIVDDFYDHASETEKSLLVTCRNEIIDRLERTRRIIAYGPELSPWGRAL